MRLEARTKIPLLPDSHYGGSFKPAAFRVEREISRFDGFVQKGILIVQEGLLFSPFAFALLHFV
jgi:hypothetical protein